VKGPNSLKLIREMLVINDEGDFGSSDDSVEHLELADDLLIHIFVDIRPMELV
jgi:hypothetical protein